MKHKIAIIGAGFTGLSAAYYLSKSGHEVTVFEKEAQAGGLAIGFKDASWDWPLEKHYHHFFTSDFAIRTLAGQVGHKLTFSRPITSTWINNAIYQLDSPISLLKFPPLSLVSRIRTGASLAFLKYNPFWQPFEYFTAKKYLKLTQGDSAWKLLWEPLMVGKFGAKADTISAAWFWARIFKRSASLGYPEGGFQSLANSIEAAAISQGANFVYNSSIESIKDLTAKYDSVICTLPTVLFEKLSGLHYEKLPGLGAVTLVLSLSKPFLANSYWLNINDRSFPFLAVVDHANFVSKAHYGGNHPLYIGNYLPADHEYFSLTADQLLKKFLPYLQKINPHFTSKDVVASWVWKAPFAQPIVTPHYSKHIPSLTTPIPNVYLANIQQVYPWDRGTNYAVELGQKAALLCVNK